MNGESLLPSEEIARSAETVADSQEPLRRPPQRGLVPQGSTPNRDDLEGPDGGAGHDDMRDAEPGGQRSSVAAVPVEQLDHAGRFSRRADLLLEAVAVERIDQPDAAFGDDRV
jgi:hypothetical protein